MMRLRRFSRVFACFLVLSVVSSVTLGPALATPESTQGTEDKLKEHAAEVSGLLPLLEQVLGPLPAVAATPFLGLAALTAAALISDMESVKSSDSSLVQSFRRNGLVSSARGYASPPLLIGLCVLALLSYLANSGKVQGSVGKLLRASEDWMAGGAFAFLALLTLTHSEPEAAEAIVTRMGFVSVSTGVLLAAAIILGLAAMMIVRFAFDILVWLNPIPFIDLVFETVKNVLSILLLGLYFLSPTVAAVLALVVLILSVFVSRWALRILSFAFRIVLNPVLARLIPPLRPVLLNRRAGEANAPEARGIALAAACSVIRGRELKKRQAGYLVKTERGVDFCYRSWIFKRHSRPLAGPGERLQLGRALAWLELRVVGPDDKTEDRFAFSRAFDYDSLVETLGAEDLEDLGAVGLVRTMVEGTSRSLGLTSDAG